MKKWFLLAITLTLAVTLLAGCACEHEWQGADCDTPKTCAKCGETDGAPLGHSWLAATCDTAKTCEICNVIEGAALGHNWQDATCDKPKTCTGCNKTEGEALGHTWQEATTEAPKTCTTCSATEGDRIITDARFTTAASKELFGTWTGTMLFDGESGLGVVIIGENLDFEVTYVYTFYNDGTVKYEGTVDEEAFFRVLRIVTIEQMYVTFEQENFTREEADEQFLSYYGMTIEEYVDDVLAQASIEDFLDINMDGVYYVADGHIYMGESWEDDLIDYPYTLDGDTLVLVDASGADLTLTKQP